MEVLLTAENLVKEYAPRRSHGTEAAVRALDGVSVEIRVGTRIGIVGASGSGKSTLALCLACVERPDSGAIQFLDRDLTQVNESELREIRPQLQLVFQDSASAFNPKFTAGEVLEEPWILRRKFNAAERRERGEELLERVGLRGNIFERMASELSGGQRQRLAIARALALQPKVLILDEALSALDYSVQAQIANLLLDLSGKAAPTERPAIILISHDLAMAARISNEIVVMQSGRIVERGTPEKIVRAAEHAATRELLACSIGASAKSDQRPAI